MSTLWIAVENRSRPDAYDVDQGEKGVKRRRAPGYGRKIIKSQVSYEDSL